MSDGSPRVGLVLGAGGMAGLSYHAGVLAALEEATGWDPRTATVIVGTSAGSIAGASLRAGLSAPDMLARAEDRPLSASGARLLSGVGPAGSPFSRAGGAGAAGAGAAGRAGAGGRGGAAAGAAWSGPLQPEPSRRRPPAEVAARLARAAARPFAARPLALLAGLLPEGTIGTEMIAGSVSSFLPDEWPAQPLWVCAVRARDGHLIVFGRTYRPAVPDAVAASCAIPGFFRPVTIDGEQYIDGGVHSPTNADVLTATELDLVVVSSPMSLTGRGLRLAIDQPARRWSRLLLDGEAVRLRRRGVHVVAFQPTPEDAAIMGPNAMDPSRRGAIAAHARESTLRRLGRADTKRRLAALAG